jgi:alkylation response protein AidB-like acyl-CoA dehydrogenase
MSFQRLGTTADDHAIADAVARFADDVLAPLAQRMDEEALSATCHVPGLAALGVMGMNLPEPLGGPGVTPTAMSRAAARTPPTCARAPCAKGTTMC